MRFVTALLVVCLCLWGGEPRKSANDYAAHISLDSMDVGAEYLVHSFSSNGQMYFARDYLVIEIALDPRTPVDFSAGSVRLRINKSRNLLDPAQPEFVAASVRYPDWTQHPETQVYAGTDDIGVSMGAPPAVGRFPGDPTARSPYPRAPEDPHKVEKTPVDAGQIVLDTALRSGRLTKPVVGNLYFNWSGNLKKLRTLALVFHTVESDRELPLR